MPELCEQMNKHSFHLWDKVILTQSLRRMFFCICSGMENESIPLSVCKGIILYLYINTIWYIL